MRPKLDITLVTSALLNRLHSVSVSFREVSGGTETFSVAQLSTFVRRWVGKIFWLFLNKNLGKYLKLSLMAKCSWNKVCFTFGLSRSDLPSIWRIIFTYKTEKEYKREPRSITNVNKFILFQQRQNSSKTFCLECKNRLSNQRPWRDDHSRIICLSSMSNPGGFIDG